MKTIEQAAKEFAERKSCRGLGEERDYLLQESILIGFKSGVEFAQRWISVDEELPDPEILVQIKYIVDIGINHKNIIEYDHDEIFVCEDGNKMFRIERNIGIKVIAWRLIELK